MKIRAGDFVLLPPAKEFFLLLLFLFLLLLLLLTSIGQQSSYSLTGVRVDAVGHLRGRKHGPARIRQSSCVFMSETTLFVETEALTLCQVIVGTIVTAFFCHGNTWLVFSASCK